MGEIKYGIAWDESYKLGCEPIDTQHRKLFELLSELIDPSADISDTIKVYKALDFLIDYAARHFADEEAVQIRYNFPDYDRHKKLHEEFKTTVAEFVQRFKSGGSAKELIKDLNEKMAKWLINHILREDQKIGAHIKGLK